jgi:excisionase family DNA binding protein
MTRVGHSEQRRVPTEKPRVRSKGQTNDPNATTDAVADDDLVPRHPRNGHRRAGSATTDRGGQRLLLTVPEAADRLGIGRSLLYELLADGRVESIHVGRLRRIPADALGTYIDRQRGAGADLQA